MNSVLTALVPLPPLPPVVAGLGAVAAACFGVSRLLPVIEANDFRLGATRRRPLPFNGIDRVARHELWWSVPIGLAVAVLLGPGAPLWVVVSIGLLAGALEAWRLRRIVFITAIVGFIAYAVTLANGTGCSTGFGRVAWIAAITAALGAWTCVRRARPQARFESALSRPLLEQAAALALLALHAVMIPTSLALGLWAETTAPVVLAIAGVVAVITALTFARRGEAVAGVAAAVLMMNVALLAGPRICVALPATTLIAVAAVVGGSAFVTRLYR